MQKPLSHGWHCGKVFVLREEVHGWNLACQIAAFVDVIGTATWRPRAVALLAVVGAIWIVSLTDLLVAPRLHLHLAVVPRRLDGLLGVFGMPFVHGSLGHLLANTVPLLFFGAMLVGRGVRYFLVVTALVAVLGGIALWLFGRQALHIGASGVVFGLFGFLVVRGLYERRLSSAAIAILVTVVYGGMIFGVLPRGDQVSWEAHLFGLLAGCGVARLGHALDRRRQVVADES